MDVSSGDVINLWDPFGEMKVISVQPAPLDIPNSATVENVIDRKVTELECSNEISNKKMYRKGNHVQRKK